MYDEARVRGIDIDNHRALDVLWTDICHHILIKSGTTKEQLVIRERNGEQFEDGYDFGAIVVLGLAVDKVMKKRLSKNQIEAMEAAMKEVVLAPKWDKPRWFRLRRIL